MAKGWAVEIRGEYPPAWDSGEIQQVIYALAGWKCEHCGILFPPGSTLAETARCKNGQPMILTVHHLDGDKSNCHYTNLIAACQRCHMHIQARWSPGGVLYPKWQQPPIWIVKRGLPYQITHHQPKLF